MDPQLAIGACTPKPKKLNVASVKIANLQERERKFFDNFMPEAATAIVLLHHVTTEQEWTWYATACGGQRCDADDHLLDLCEAIESELTKHGHDSGLVQYPKASGLQFRIVAQACGLGVIGTNAFLFHPEWGPWVHLRVMGTTAELELQPAPTGDELCDQCGLCVTECPARAISDDAFEGLRCRAYRKSRGEYEPHGPNGLLPYCKRCVLVCPKGELPVPTEEAAKDDDTIALQNVQLFLSGPLGRRQ